MLEPPEAECAQRVIEEGNVTTWDRHLIKISTGEICAGVCEVSG